jgi:hypothetical protein
MIVTGKPKWWEKNLSQFHFVHHMHYHAIKSAMRGCGLTA